MDGNKRLSVLMVAAACHPDKGSEPGIGWGWVEALSAYHNLWVIAGEQEGNREAIDRRVDGNPDLRRNARFYFLPRNEWTHLCDWFPPLYYHRHRLWHLRAFHLAQQLCREHSLHLCHQLTMAGFREPGYLWKLDLPFVWGPVGGTANVPLRFARDMRAADICYHAAKITMNELQLRFSPRVTKAFRKARILLTTDSNTRQKLLEVLGIDSTMIGHSGASFPEDAAQSPAERASAEPLCIGWSGLHIARKALPILFRALVLLPDECHWELEIAGSGPLTDKWQRLARSLGIGGHCHWHGWLNKPAAIDLMRRCHVFALPSLHESVPAVLMEALSFGVPVVCLDHCGMADIVTPECGFKVPVTSARQEYQAFADVLLRLWRNEDQRRAMGREAAIRSRQHTYASKAEVLNGLYYTAVQGTKEDSHPPTSNAAIE
jgi:glycosyltransferase involved in cell wall biosynthesis